MKEHNQKQSKIYTHITKQFKIVSAFSQSNLNITLEDYADWITYYKSYSEEDIGKQIHRKVDLTDLFQSLSMNSQNLDSDEKKMKERQIKQKDYKDYQFGEIITFKDLPCYKVDKNGQITVYINSFDHNGKKKCYESKLSLVKVQKLYSESQRFLHKIQYQKYMNKGQQKLIFLKVEECDKIIQTLRKYQSQIQFLKSQNVEEKNQYPNKRISSQLQRRQRFEKRDLQEKLNEKQKEQQKLNQKIKELEQQLKKERQIKTNINQKLKKMQQTNNMKANSFRLLQHYSEKIILQQAKRKKGYTPLFRQSQNLIEYIGQGINALYCLNKIIPIHQKFTIKLKLIRLNKKIKICLIDFKKLLLESQKMSLSYIFQNEFNTNDTYNKQGKTILLSYEYGEKFDLQIDKKIFSYDDKDNKLKSMQTMYIIFVQLCTNDIIEIL